ncbi:hypothetical protein D3C78_18610 [compost metagenome]
MEKDLSEYKELITYFMSTSADTLAKQITERGVEKEYIAAVNKAIEAQFAHIQAVLQSLQPPIYEVYEPCLNNFYPGRSYEVKFLENGVLVDQAAVIDYSTFNKHFHKVDNKE